jgi:formylglycine-generating enzyme required for sulfatase activity
MSATRILLAALVSSVAGMALSAQQATYTNSVGMEFVRIEPGRMTVGRFQPPYAKPPDLSAPAPQPAAAGQAPQGRGGRGGGRGRGGPPPTPEEYKLIEAGALADYREGFEVAIERPFFMARSEVTQAQWTKVMGSNPSMFQGVKVAGSSENHPVDSVTWAQAKAFVQRLNQLEQTDVYRLPTEFEWEYAARAGAEDDIPWDAIRRQAHNTGGTTQPVGGREANPWGLYDMLGNVWEWVEDYYNEKIFADPVPPRSGAQHVLKGGGFLADVKNMTYMTHGAGPGSTFDVGFRIVREIR